MYVVKTAIISVAVALCATFIMIGVAYGQSKPEITYIKNSDIGFTISDLTPSRQWDYIASTNFCFSFNPPTANGSAAVQVTMELKDKANPSSTVEEVIGASVNQLITNPSTVRCGSSTLRRLTAQAPFNIPPQERWVEACPRIKVKVVTKGPWRPFPQEDVAYIERSFLCPDGIVTTAPTAAPTTPPSTPSRIPFRPRPTTIPPTSTPTPNVNAIEGRITVFSCAQPETVTLSYCDDPSGASCADLNLATTPQDQAIWLDDETNERTFIYKYRITKDKSGNALDPSKTYSVFNANARIKRF
ncbi:MAG: hypothetical protein UZ22_OP11002000409 [Microgenomates bacterium OLB23]|nr:MAG: hypothetical protein UZ22_OP11002000409 [Microgenomates bacterium OLB23]